MTKPEKFNSLSGSDLTTLRTSLKSARTSMHATLDAIEPQSQIARDPATNDAFVNKARACLMPILAIGKTLQTSHFQENSPKGIKEQTTDIINEWMKKIHEMKSVESVGLPVSPNAERIRNTRGAPEIKNLRDVLALMPNGETRNFDFIGNKKSAEISAKAVRVLSRA